MFILYYEYLFVNIIEKGRSMPPRTEKLSDNLLSNLLAVKKQLKLSIRRIAETTNKASAIVGCYFNGAKNPPKDWVETFCRVYCVDKTWLIEGVGEPNFIGKQEAAVIHKTAGTGLRIRQLRKYFDLTQGEFGERIGISQHAVFDLEKDNTKLTPFSAGRIEEQFNIGKDWLMFGDEGKKNYPLSEKLTDWLWKNENIRKELWERMERDNKNEEKNVET